VAVSQMLASGAQHIVTLYVFSLAVSARLSCLASYALLLYFLFFIDYFVSVTSSHHSWHVLNRSGKLYTYGRDGQLRVDSVHNVNIIVIDFVPFHETFLHLCVKLCELPRANAIINILMWKCVVDVAVADTRLCCRST
jgi:hypothetical protein